MKYLTVLGTGKWVIGRGADRQRFGPGIHEVSDEVADMARASSRKTLMVTDEKPRIVRDGGDGPLTMEDIRVGTRGVRLIEDEVVEVEVEEEQGVPLDFPCPRCPRAFPSAPARDRHVEMNHGD